MKKINFSVLFSHLLLAVLVTAIFLPGEKKTESPVSFLVANCTDGDVLYIQTCAFSVEKRIGIRDYILTVDSVLDLGNRGD